MSSQPETIDLFFMGRAFDLNEALAERNYNASKPEYTARDKFDSAQTFLSMMCIDDDITNFPEAVLDEQDKNDYIAYTYALAAILKQGDDLRRRLISKIPETKVVEPAVNLVNVSRAQLDAMTIDELVKGIEDLYEGGITIKSRDREWLIKQFEAPQIAAMWSGEDSE